MRPERLHRIARDLVALDPADGLLDVVVEILHADGGAVHADLGQRGEPGLVDLVGVDLDGEFGALGQRHRLGDRSGKRRASWSGCSKVGVPPPQWRRAILRPWAGSP
jgi:hypothetical protein